ncbi:MAG TPA: AI-2E family transporter, partial [Herpetosiphonaceae bacterium]|nr:AI-2E family transporter [Herpetosiphonaceae bacterium]
MVEARDGTRTPPEVEPAAHDNRVEVVEIEPAAIDPAVHGVVEISSPDVPPVTRVDITPAPTPARGWSWRTAVRLGLVALALLAVGWILWASAAALTPFIIGLVLAYLMLPGVDLLEHRMPRWAAILIVYILTFGALGIAMAYIIPPAINQINEVVNSIPGWYN